MHTRVFPARMSVYHTHAWCLLMSERGIRFPELELGLRTTMWVLEVKSGSSVRTSALNSCLQPSNLGLVNVISTVCPWPGLLLGWHLAPMAETNPSLTRHTLICEQRLCYLWLTRVEAMSSRLLAKASHSGGFPFSSGTDMSAPRVHMASTTSGSWFLIASWRAVSPSWVLPRHNHHNQNQCCKNSQRKQHSPGFPKSRHHWQINRAGDRAWL